MFVVPMVTELVDASVAPDTSLGDADCEERGVVGEEKGDEVAAEGRGRVRVRVAAHLLS